MAAIVETCNESEEIEEALSCIFQELKAFSNKYDVLFKDENARESFANVRQKFQRNIWQNLRRRRC